jgi:hypothetical protein
MKDSVIAGVVQVLLDRNGYGQVAVDGHVLPRVEKVTIECEAGKIPVATVTLRGVDVTAAADGEIVITTLDWGDMQRQWSEK